MKHNPDILCDQCEEFDRVNDTDGGRLDFLVVCDCSMKDVAERNAKKAKSESKKNNSKRGEF